MNTCPRCSSTIPADANYCQACGHPVRSGVDRASVREAAYAFARAAGKATIERATSAAESIKEEPAKAAQPVLAVAAAVVVLLLFIALVVHPLAAFLGLPAIVVGYLIRQAVQKLL